MADAVLERLRSAADAYYEGLRRRFEIVVDADALAGGAAGN